MPASRIDPARPGQPARSAGPGTGVIKVAVVGLGWAARTIWLPLLTEHGSFRVVAVADPEADARTRGVDVAGRDVLAVADAAELSADEVDLAIVAVPNRLHATIAATLLRKGISVFLEKPVCLTTAEAALLADAERSGGALLLAGSAARYRSDVEALRERIASLGPIRHLELSWIRSRGIPAGAGWFIRRDLAGGGALVDLGWHLLDIGFLLAGTQRIRDVLGTTSADFLRQPDWRAAWRADDPAGDRRAASDVEDAARALLITDEGVSMSLRASWASHESRDLTQIVVEGRAGTARLDCTFGFSPNRLPEPSLTLQREGRTESVPLPAEPVGSEYRRQVAALPALLRDRRMRGRAIAEAACTVEVIERLYEPARPAKPHADLALPPVTALSEVRQLRSALAGTVSGDNFVLHGRIRPGEAQVAGPWPRIEAAFRLALLAAVGLSYGSSRRVVTLLQLDDTGQLDASERYARMLGLSRVIRAAAADQDEVARTERRLVKLARLPGAAGPDGPATALLTQLRHAIALMRAYSEQAQAIDRTLRAATYLAAGSDGQAGGSQLELDRRADEVYAPFAHALTIEAMPALLPSTVANPVILRLPRLGATAASVARLCAHLDPLRSPGRLLIRVSSSAVLTSPALAAQAAAVRQAGHRPVWLFDCQVAAWSRGGAGPSQLRAVIDRLASQHITLTGISIPITGRHLEQIARITEVLAEQGQHAQGARAAEVREAKGA
jgi:oxidoreductase